jgi:hypothetical protein
MSLRFLEKRNNLLAGDAGKSIKENLDRVAALQMIEQAFCRNSRSDENRLSTQNLGIAMNDFAHGWK